MEHGTDARPGGLTRGGVAAIAAAYVLSRVVAFVLGVRFDSSTSLYFAQFLDPPLLREALFESLWALHAQPPVMNLVLGIAVKLAPVKFGLVQWPLFVGAGALAAVAGAGLLVRLGVRPVVAACGVLALGVSAPWILYEHYFFYPHVIHVLLVLAGYGLVRSGGRADRWFVVGFGALAVLSLTRSLFHPLYLVFAGGAAVLLLEPGARRRGLAVVGLALVPALLWSTKNATQSGFFGTSSWSGFSHFIGARAAADPLLAEEVESGGLSPVVLLPPFSPPGDYVPFFEGHAPGDGVPRALLETGKTTPSPNPVNYNHWVYPHAGAAYGRAARRAVANDPGRYARAVASNAALFFGPMSDDPFVRGNRGRLAWWATAFDRMEGSAIAWLVLAVGAGFSARRSCDPCVDRGERLFLLFAVGTFVWVMAVSCLFESGENNRMRFGPMAVFLGASLLGLRSLFARARGCGFLRAADSFLARP